MRTTILRLSGHCAAGPNGVVLQSNALTRLAISGGELDAPAATGFLLSGSAMSRGMGFILATANGLAQIAGSLQAG